ncbi:MAG: tetratricopeptide repeat protein [Chloroflexota bacterium]|nr:tetratricopeptide repeat protein [Anaerolineales bacterium]MCB8968433.1 tetratricopeptide repeat protein [Ardenticatenaceae bacterium]
MKDKLQNIGFDAVFKHGTQLLHRGKSTEALPFLERAYELEPTHVDAGINLSGAYIMTKQFRKAVALLEPLREVAPDNAMIWTNLGAAYLGNPVLSRDEEQLRAIAAFEQALTLNPAAPHVAYNIGLIYRDRRNHEQAIYWFRRALQANPNDRDAANLLRRLTEAQNGEDAAS